MSQPTIQPPSPPQSATSSPLAAVRGLFRRATSTIQGTLALSVGAALLVTVCGCCSLTALANLLPPASGSDTPAGAALTSTSSSSASTIPATPTATVHLVPTATPRPQPTVTPTPQLVNGPYLGGTYSNFAAVFGPADDGASTWSDTVVAGQHVTLTIDTNSQSDTTDGAPRAYTLSVRPTPTAATTWNDAQAQAVLAHLFPPDGQYVKTMQSSNGPDHIYHSVDLAATFDASMFTNDAMTASVPPGNFDYQCKNSTYPNGTAYTICFVTVGQYDAG